MSKARTLADFISDGSEFADGTISVAEVSGAAPLASPSFTGNVGIGVTPATFYGRALHVHDTGTAGANIRLTDSNSGTTGNDGMDILQINNTSYIINREAGGMNFYTGGQLRYTIQGDGTHVFNENSLDSDFRVESDGYANMLFVDAGNNRVGIASGSPDQSLDIAVGGLQIKGNIAAPASGTSAMQVDYYSGGARYWSRGATLGVRGTHKFYTLTNTSGSQITPLIIETTGGVTLNEDSADADFRVESDSNTHMLFVDAGNDFVGINKSSPEVVLHVRSTSAGAMTTFESSSANSSGGPNIRLWRNSASPADGDGLARLVFQGNNDAAERIDYAEIQTEIIDASDGTEDGLFQIETVVDGVSRNRLRLTGTESIFNDGGRDLDFRVESDSNTDVLFVQGSGSGAVGINNNAPSYNLDVSGSTRTTQMVPSYSSITGTSSSANWWKLGTISNLAGSRSLKIRIQGTYSYSAGGQISGESTILFRGNNATTTIQGTFWSETEGLSHLSGVPWKLSLIHI